MVFLLFVPLLFFGQVRFIPIVFHVIADNTSEFANFDAARLQAQLAELNAQFTNNNTDIQFCLAQTPPAPHTWASLDDSGAGGTAGITYRLSNSPDYTTIDFGDFNNSNYSNGLFALCPFPANQYLNVYIVNDVIIGGDPAAVGGSSAGPSFQQIDGVAIEYQTVTGSGVIGQTLVHEVGHWLGLYHVFDNDNSTNCTDCATTGDRICDTYPQALPTRDLAVTPCNGTHGATLGCHNTYQWGQNHMDYAPEGCLSVFTPEQSARMNQTLDNGRSFLVSNINLINTGLMGNGAGFCINNPAPVSEFQLSAAQICPNDAVALTGVLANYDGWTFTVVSPTPGTGWAFNGVSSGINSSPAANITLTDVGIWTIQLETTANGITTTHSHTIEVLNCQPTDERNRVVIPFETNENWGLAGISLDNAHPDISLTEPEGYIVAGSSLAAETSAPNDFSVILRTNLKGEVQWRRELRIAGQDARFFDVSSIDFNGQPAYAFVGYVGNNATNTTQMLLVITDISGGILQQYSYSSSTWNCTAGVHTIQMLNGNLAVAGFSGQGTEPIHSKEAIVMCVDANNGAILYERRFDTPPPVGGNEDYDIAQRLTDMSNGTTQRLLVSGQFNGDATNRPSGIYLSCLDVSNAAGTQVWGFNAVLPAGTNGKLSMVATAYQLATDRLFAAYLSDLAHGIRIVEIDYDDVLGTAAIIERTLVTDLAASNLYIDSQNDLIVSGWFKGSGGNMMIAKLPMAGGTVVWDPLGGVTGALVEVYQNSNPVDYVDALYTPIISSLGLYREGGYLVKYENIAQTPMNGYMFASTVENPITPANNRIALLFNQVDNNLIGACEGTWNFATEFLPDGAVPNVPVPLNIAMLPNASSATSTSLYFPCSRIGCDPYGLATTNISICTTFHLANDFPGQDIYNFLWTMQNGDPALYLDNPYTAEPNFTELNFSGSIYYHVTARDPNTHCIVYERDVNVSNLPLIFNSAFCGQTATLIPTSGAAPYTYLWDNGATTNTATGLTPGDYFFTITDAGGCSVMDMVSVPNPLTIINSGITPLVCGTPNTGAINISVTGGVPLYSYEWSNGVFTQDITGLNAGTYTVTVSDGNNCTTTQNFSVPSTTSGTVSVLGSVTNLLCSGVNIGSINITVSGGSSPYTYNWNGGVSTEDRTGLAAGVYTVTARDANLCSSTASFTVTQPSTLSVSGAVTNSQCNNSNNGAINITVGGGTAPYTYNWNNGATTEDRTGLSAGVHSITITDANGCTVSSSFTITAPAAITISRTISSVSCNGGSNGAINITVSGGVAPYTYNWGGGITTEDRTGLTAGNYFVTITDANGCTAVNTTAFSVIQPTVINVTGIPTNVACNGGTNGAINLFVNGGIGPYTYNWNGGVTTEDRTGLTAGVYAVTVRDNNNCTATWSTTITQPNAIVITTNNITNIPCNGGNTGAIDISSMGGTGAHTYNWRGGITTQDRTGLAAGNYTVTVRDANNCTVAQSFTITQPAAIAVNQSTTNVLCNGANTGAIDITVSNGTTPYTYNWGSGITTEDRTGLSAGTYTVTVQDANNCSVSQSVTITQPSAVTVSITQNVVPCNNATAEATAIALGGTSPYTYSWSNGQNTNVATGLTSGNYSATATDANSCTATASITVVTQPTLSLSQTVTGYGTNSVTITQTVCATGAGNVTYTIGNTLPTGWIQTSLVVSSSITANPSGTACNSHTLVLTLVPPVDLCLLDVVNIAQLTASAACLPPTASIVYINTGQLPSANLPTIIPASITTFAAAVNATLLPPTTAVGVNVAFRGNITLTQPSGASPTYTFQTSKIRMAPGVQLTIAAKAQLALDNVQVNALCNQLWRSITVNQGGFLTTSNNTHIEGGLYAVEALGGPGLGGNNATLRIQNTTFNRNYIGLYIPPNAAGNNVVIRVFNDNVFDCVGGQLLPNYAGSPVAVTGTRSFAGAEMHQQSVFSIPTAPTSRNTFKNMANGIVAYQTNVSVQRAEFRNLLPRSFPAPPLEGHGIYADGMGGVYNVSVVGFGAETTATPSFTNCRNGVTSIANNLVVTKNNMTTIQNTAVDVSASVGRIIRISGNTMEAFWAGVHSRLNDPCRLNVIENTVAVGKPYLLSQIPLYATSSTGNAAIRIDGGAVPNDETLILRNKISIYRASSGIALLHHYGGAVCDIGMNDIDVRAVVSTVTKTGIALTDCQNLLLRCNDIQSVPVGINTPGAFWAGNTRGIVADLTPNTIYSCNRVAFLELGMVFAQDCSNSEVRGNRFDTHRIGLYYMNGVALPPQPDKGNMWFGRYYGGPTSGAAVHEGTGLDIAQSFYTTTAGAPFTPTTLPLGNNSFTPFWFTSTGASPSPFDCNSPTLACDQLLPNNGTPILNNLDVAVVNNQVPNNPAALPWHLRYSLYDKLDKNPVLRFNPAMAQFYNTYQHQSIGNVAAITTARNTATAINSPYYTQWQQYSDAVTAYTDSIYVVDSLGSLGLLSDAVWAQQKEGYQQALQNLALDAKTLYGLWLGQNQTESQTALTLNAAITATNIIEQNEREVNDIYLQTVAVDNYHFTPNQRQRLYDIAHQCPQVAGAAVYNARSLYTLIAHEEYIDNCMGNQPQAKMAQDTCWGDVAFVNPSFEDTIRQIAHTPVEWTTCLNTPDTQPQDGLPGLPLPSDGASYLGMASVVAGGFREGVGQFMSNSLQAGKLYRFSADIAMPGPSFWGADTSTKVLVWLGDSLCQRDQLAFIIDEITDTIWNTQLISIVPNQDYNYISIYTEVIFTPPSKGILIDNLRPVPCDTTPVPPVDTFHAEAYHEQTEYISGLEEEIVILIFILIPIRRGN